MKMLCSWCKKLIGEKEPFDDPSKIEGRCAECTEKFKVSNDPTEQAQIEADLRALAEMLVDAYLDDCRKKRQGGSNVQVATKDIH